MSLANKVSVFRILLVPCIVALLLYYHPQRDGLRYVAAGVFFLGICSDALDGFLARSKRQQSELGAWLDPIADKLLILGTLISLSTIRALPVSMRIPAWFNLIVISRDVLLLVGALLIFCFTGKLAMKPNRAGKATIAAQMALVLSVLLGLPITQPLLIGAAALTIASGISYVRIGTKLLG